MTVIFALVTAGCASSRAKEVSSLKKENLELELTNQKLKNDVTQMHYRLEAVFKTLRTPDTEYASVTPAIKWSDTAMIKRLKSRGLEVVTRDGNPAVVCSGFFASGSSALSGDGKKRLKEAGRIIKSETVGADFRICGYTDNTPGPNDKISGRRANTVRDFLVKECGFDAKRVIAKGMGAKNPVADNKTKSGRQKNRRIEILILSK